MSVVHWVKSHVNISRPAGPVVRLASFSPESPPIAGDWVRAEGDAWRIETGGKRSFRLFEIPAPDVERCKLTYRAMIRSENVRARAYLEMWCRFAGLGDLRSKGAGNPVRGSHGWTPHETTYELRPGQHPDKIKLNITFDGPGTIWIKDIELLASPLR